MLLNILLISLLFFQISFASSLRILHLSFHEGCINDFNDVAQTLNLDVTSWFILSSNYSEDYFDGQGGNNVYNIGHDRAEYIWNKHKNFFNEFDLIITSDTAPLSRIFLQNGWDKPLIIWVCNRFDYHDGANLDCDFPDVKYYELMRKATSNPKVKIISYTDYELHYARSKGITWNDFTIKPIGSLPKNDSFYASQIPLNVKKEKTIFLYPRLEQEQINYVLNECKHCDIPVYTGIYNGPKDITDFIGVIYFPYQWSNLALFENLQYGIVHFVPSEKFLRNAIELDLPIRYPGGSSYTVLNNQLELCEWYCSNNNNYIVYFDSWMDLKSKIESIDYDCFKNKIKEFGISHRSFMLERWENVFSEMGLK